MALADWYEGYEAHFDDRGERKARNPQGKTSNAARAQNRLNARVNRQELARENILFVMKRLPETTSVQEYVDWLKACITQGVQIDENCDVHLEFSRSGKKAGGQNVNKVSSAARCIHNVTGIFVRNDETRDQFRNRANAFELLKDNVRDHVNDWKTFLEIRSAVDNSNLDRLTVDLVNSFLP